MLCCQAQRPFLGTPSCFLRAVDPSALDAEVRGGATILDCKLQPHDVLLGATAGQERSFRNRVDCWALGQTAQAKPDI